MQSVIQPSILAGQTDGIQQIVQIAQRSVCLAPAVLKESAVVICSFFIMFLFSVLGSSFRMLCRVPGPEVNFVTSQAKQMELQVDEGGRM